MGGCYQKCSLSQYYMRLHRRHTHVKSIYTLSYIYVWNEWRSLLPVINGERTQLIFWRRVSCVAKIKYCISKSLQRKATPSIKRWPGLASRSASYTSAVFKTHQWPAVLHGCHVSSLQHGLCSLFWVSPASPFWCYEYLLEHQMCTNTLVRKVPSTKAQLALVWAILDQICSVQWFGHFS